jgi:hypothetical protein
MEGEGLKITSLEVLNGKRPPNQSYETKKVKKSTSRGKWVEGPTRMQFSTQNPLHVKKKKKKKKN